MTASTSQSKRVAYAIVDGVTRYWIEYRLSASSRPRPNRSRCSPARESSSSPQPDELVRFRN